ncbi:MAG: hypothetical protein AAFR40_08485, partial [Pseudomonadota bacterium]
MQGSYATLVEIRGRFRPWSHSTTRRSAVTVQAIGGNMLKNSLFLALVLGGTAALAGVEVRIVYL